eukprot:11021381-Karenia_brevis.AAC.1
MANALWDVFTLLGPTGSLWEQYSQLGESDRREFQKMTVDEFMDAPLASLRRYLSVFSKLRKWCIDRGLQLHELNPVQLSLWLHSLKTRGPTVAHHYFWSLNWMKEH